MEVGEVPSVQALANVSQVTDASSEKPVVSRLRIFPFKALDGLEVTAAALTARGGLQHDRMFAIVAADGAFVNGKREPRVHELRVGYDAAPTCARFASPRFDETIGFDFDEDPRPLAAWLGRHFGYSVSVLRDDDGGFPDDTRAAGPTIVSTATLAAVASWFPGLDVDGMRVRLRATVEIGGVPAFWEDRLYGADGAAVAFRIGEVAFEGTNPCARCVVPSRDPLTGAAIRTFQKTVAERRAATLPPWADRSRFDHFYRLAVNTRPALTQTGRVLRLGDAVRITEASLDRIGTP